MEIIPLSYTAFRSATVEISNFGTILSKPEMKRRGISYFDRDANETPGLEYELGTEDDICLQIDFTFERSMRYGGPWGPRLIFNPRILYHDSVFILPLDQKAYSGKPDMFNVEKRLTEESKRELIGDYLGGKLKTAPEVHVPKALGLGNLVGILGTEDALDDFENLKERIIMVPIYERPSALHPEPADYRIAYKKLTRLLHSDDIC